MRTVSGSSGMEVAELRRVHLHSLAEKAWKADRVQLLATLDEAQASPELRFEKLREHDLQRGTAGPLLLYTFQFAGCDDIIATACAEAKVDPVLFRGDLTGSRLQEIARELIGIRAVGGEQGE